MLTPEDIQGMAIRKYPDYLRSLVTGENLFPLRIRFGKPDTTDDFAKLKEEITQLANGNFGYTVEWEEKNTRRWGLQKLPVQVRFDTQEQFVAALGKGRELTLFQQDLAITQQRLPMLKDWLASHVKWIVEFHAVWEGLLAVCEYFLAHPRPGLYARQLPVQVHTKFVIENRQVLASMLDHLLPPAGKAEGNTFEERFGLKPLEPLIRFRALDPLVRVRFGFSHDRMGLPLETFGSLQISGLVVLITENLMNFECLPCVKQGLAIFGQGNAAELLHRVRWLAHCKVYYWGDIDEHGFHILARLRRCFPNVQSLNMDITTLESFRNLAGTGEKAGREPSNLTEAESAAFKIVERETLRLEQEKIPQDHALFVLLNQGLECYDHHDIEQRHPS